MAGAPAAAATAASENEAPKAHAADPAAELAALRQRIKAGLNAIGEDPKPKDAIACKECFQRGWIAAMRYLQGK